MLKNGTVLQNGKYIICGILGQGGFGITYLAEHAMLGTKVAIKEFFPKSFCDRDKNTNHVTVGTSGSRELVARYKAKFIKEARSIAKIDNPHVIKTHDVFEENNTAYYVMEYIDGKSLYDIVKANGPLPEEKATDYIVEVGFTLTNLHINRINHLDVKPANIMIRNNDDATILIDFGVSKQYDSEGNQTSTTPVGISHGYAPIEMYRDGGVKSFSPQTDLYSLAATLYYLLTGTVPPQAPNLLDEELVFPANISKYLVTAISQAMSSKRSDRQGSISEFIGQIMSDDAEICDNEVNTSSSDTKEESDPLWDIPEFCEQITSDEEDICDSEVETSSDNEEESDRLWDIPEFCEQIMSDEADICDTDVNTSSSDTNEESDRLWYETDESYNQRKLLQSKSKDELKALQKKNVKKLITCAVILVLVIIFAKLGGLFKEATTSEPSQELEDSMGLVVVDSLVNEDGITEYILDTPDSIKVK